MSVKKARYIFAQRGQEMIFTKIHFVILHIIAFRINDYYLSFSFHYEQHKSFFPIFLGKRGRTAFASHLRLARNKCSLIDIMPCETLSTTPRILGAQSYYIFLMV